MPSCVWTGAAAPERESRSSAAASVDDNWRAPTIWSSNCFNVESAVWVSFMCVSSTFVPHPKLFQQAVQNCDRFLPRREQGFQFILGFCKISFLGCAGFANFGELGLDLFRRCFVVNCLLQIFNFGTGLAKETAAAAAIITAARAAGIAAAIPTAKHCAPAVSHQSHLGVHDFVDAGLNQLPFCVVFYVHFLFEPINSVLAPLRRITSLRLYSARPD